MFLRRIAASGVFLLSCFFVFSGLAGAGAWTLAEGGASGSAVIISDEAGSIERHAADELSSFLSKVTGAEIRQSNSPVRGKYSIWVGTPGVNPQVGRLRLSGRVEALDAQGFLLYSDRNGLVITGREPLGVLYGAYAFLEEHVGMRWFFPGEYGEYRPDIPDLRIGRIDDEQNPAFEQRDVFFGSASTSHAMKDSWDWLARNRMQFTSVWVAPEECEKRGALTMAGGHILNRMVPDELFEEHPEYFGLYDGERRRQEGHRAQPCTSHPEVIRLAAEYMIDWFDRNPGGMFTLNNNDWPHFCECDNCAALDPPEEIGRGAEGDLSTRFFTFKDEVAKRVWEEHPGARINTLAYQRFRLPPLGFVPDRRLMVHICNHGGCFRHAISDTGCSANKGAREMFEQWQEFENPRSFRPYYTSLIGGGRDRENVKAVPLERIVSDDMRYMHGLGHTRWNIGTIPPDGSFRHHERLGRDTTAFRKYWRANLHMHYIQAKLAWDIELDFEELMSDINEKFYGPASEPMSEYRELLLRLWEETPGHFMYASPFVMTGKTMMAPNAMRHLQELLDEAERKAGGVMPYAARVEDDRRIFELSWKKAHEQYLRLPRGDITAAGRKSPVVIDGNLDEEDWINADRITGFVRGGTDGELAAFQTHVRLLYDDEYLYAGVELEEPYPDKIVMETRERDGPVTRDDSLELFIDPDGEGLRYVHIAVNAAGVVRDSERLMGMPASGDVSFDSEIELAASIGEDRWTAEMKIPAAALGGEIRPGGRWLMEVGRTRGAKAGSDREVSSWMDGTFHNPESFRGVSFDRAIIQNGRFDDVIVMDTEELLARHGMRGWEYGNEPPRMVDGWRLHHASSGRFTVVEDGVYAGRHAARIEGINPPHKRAAMHQRMDVLLEEGTELEISFAARGEEPLRVSIFHYRRDAETGRLIGGIPTSRAGEVELGPEWERYEFIHTHREELGDTGTLAFYTWGGWAEIDDVYVTMAEN